MNVNNRILVVGANGQIGLVLTAALRARYGTDQVVATDIRPATNPPAGPFAVLDVLDSQALEQLIQDYNINQIYHLAAILSARGESDPRWAWQINMEGLFNVLEAARLHKLKVFFPSSIAVFGPSTPRDHTPQHTAMEPTTVYGISKVAGEQWCQYYFQRYGVDVRSVRYPGIIGYQSMPGGGTTDYAVEVYHRAVKGEHFNCFLRPDTRLPMLYMDDAIAGTLALMEAPPEQVKIRTSYNLAGMSFTPAEVVAEITKYFPDFSVSYQPDYRQRIADSWTQSIDDGDARRDWGWQARFDLPAMTQDMISHLQQYYALTQV
ncbi:MAG: NAD-dependent epimerase/dehydratase family protein [Lewinellaceae bacterium]|nr:NAD-dependent epimerase/dehydratase family protein [Lewinellaceae bacterium]